MFNHIIVLVCLRGEECTMKSSVIFLLLFVTIIIIEQ